MQHQQQEWPEKAQIASHLLALPVPAACQLDFAEADVAALLAEGPWRGYPQH